MATHTSNMGVVQKKMGKYEEALEVHSKLLEIDILVHGGSHLSVAGSYGNLGNVLHDMGKPEEAFVHLQKGL